jgi:hypothetical protein
MEWLLWAFWKLCFMETGTGNNFFHFWANLMSSVYHFFVQFKERLCRITEYILLSNDDLLVFTPSSIMSLFRCLRGVCYLHLQSDWIWFGWMLQHSPEPPEILYIIIFLYFLPDFGRNFVTYWYWNLITVTDFERKEGDLFTFVYNFAIFMGSSSFYTTTLNVCLLSSSSAFLILLK